MNDSIITSFRVATSLENLALALHRIINAIESFPRRPSLEFPFLRLALDEALTNAMEHGNGWERGKFVYIHIYSADSSIFVVIEDEGSGFIPGSPSLSPDSRMARRGRGIRLITGLCDAEWDRRGRRVRLCFPVE